MTSPIRLDMFTVMLGLSYEVRQVLLGHCMPGIIERYSHGGKAFDAMMREALDKLVGTYVLCKKSCKSF